MGFEPELILYCDNGCGAEENYGSGMFNVSYHEIELPEGWRKDYDNGDSIFGYVCGDCVEEFERGPEDDPDRKYDEERDRQMLSEGGH